MGVPGAVLEASELLALVYEELHSRAIEAMRRLPPGQTIQPTALVHEAYLAMVTRKCTPWQDERHFLAVATRALRTAIVDRIRARRRLKRGGGRAPLSLGDGVEIAMPRASDKVVLGVDAALDRLREVDARAADVVAMRFFLGMTEAAVAQAIGVTERTVRRDWTFARAWLMRELADTGGVWSEPDEQ